MLAIKADMRNGKLILFQHECVCVCKYFMPPLHKSVLHLGHPSQKSVDMPLFPFQWGINTNIPGAFILGFTFR